MTVDLHLNLGLIVLVVNLAVGLWGLLLDRRGRPPGRPLVVTWWLAVGLLGLQLLGGMAVWLNGSLPSVLTMSPLQRIISFGHGGGTMIALIVALGLIGGAPRRTARRYAVGALVGALVAALNFSLLSMRWV